MGDKDLENIINNIGQEEMAAAQKQAQIERLKQLVKKQKNEMAEQQKLVNELQSRIENMYDLPADVEQLKTMIGEMRAEISSKDTQLEMAHGNVSSVEAELNGLKRQIDPLNQQLQTYINQVGELRAKLVEQQSLLKMRDQRINNLELKLESNQSNLDKMEQEFALRVQDRLKEFMETEDQYRERIEQMENKLKSKTKQTKVTRQEGLKQINVLKDQLEDKDAKIDSLTASLESTESAKERFQKSVNQLHDELTQVKKELANQEAITSELKMKIKDLTAENENQKIEIEKYHALRAEMEILQEKYESLKEFKDKNENSITNLNKLSILFEEEPLFKIFLLLRDVGAMRPDDMKNSLGVPTMTMNKYIQKFKKVGLIQETGQGKVRLQYPMKK